MTRNFDYIFNNLLKLFPNPDTELQFSNPFQLLIAVMLSAQTTDKQVNKITEQLFKEIKKPEDILKSSEEIFTQKIHSINYYNSKWKHIYQTAKDIIKLSNEAKKWNKNLTKNEGGIFKKYGYYIPESIEWLMSFPGVWEKTAKVILYVLYKHPIIAVDTHVHRVANRLWIVNTKEPLETSREIEKAIPKKRKSVAHHVLILFGRYYCTAKNPKCTDCILKSQCNSIKQIKNLDSSQ